MSILEKPLTLPCGDILPGRLVKAATTEQLAGKLNRANERHARLYDLWGQGGAHLLITGNVQIDPWCLEAPGNIVICGPQPDEHRIALKNWVHSSKQHGAKIWMQISHAGRQTPKIVTKSPKAPSPVPVNMPGGVFGKPVALSEAEIERLIKRFAHCADEARLAGFDGVQIHAAHGYLLSQFLSPLVNQRKDHWGGSLDNRARLLIEILRATRSKVGRKFPIGVKLNSSDFQKDGYHFEECLQVVDKLTALKVDLTELSGGNYEQPKMMDMAGIGKAQEEPLTSKNSAHREAYFQEFARVVKKRTPIPVMVTGGFRTLPAMKSAIDEGAADMVGLARPICADPLALNRLKSGEIDRLHQPEMTKKLGPGLLGPNSFLSIIKALTGFGRMSWLYLQLQDFADGKQRYPKYGLLKSFTHMQKIQKKQARALVKRKKIAFDRSK